MMQIRKITKYLSIVFMLFFVLALVICRSDGKRENETIDTSLTEAMNSPRQVSEMERVVGILGDGSNSKVVCYNTDTWDYTVLADLPGTTSDNYAALSPDEKYLAYTTWDDSYVRRYLNVIEIDTGNIVNFFMDIMPRTEIIKISWMPDCETLLYIRNNTEISSYQQIELFNIHTGSIRVAVKGEVWKIRQITDIDKNADDFYLKGSGDSLRVKEIVKNTDTNDQWNYYLSADDLDSIYKEYGGVRDFDYSAITNLMNVEFSSPKCSPDGKKIVYSTKLDRNSAPGERTPLWVASAIWLYDIQTNETTIIYSQPDEGAIGRVDWIGVDEVCFVTYYDFQGSRDNINYLNIKTGEVRILFHYTDKHYNNVTLLTIGNHRISFTSSPKGASFHELETYIMDTDSGESKPIQIQFDNQKVILENFVYYQKFDFIN